MLHHSHTPRNTSPNEGLAEQLGASSHFYLFISGVLDLVGCRTRPSFGSQLRLAGDSPWQRRGELLPGPKAHLLQLWLIYRWPGISVFFVSNRWNVHWLSYPTCLGSERSTAGQHTFSKMSHSFGPLFVVQSLFHVQQSLLNFWNTNVTYLFQQRTDRLQTRDVKHRKEFELVEILSPFISPCVILWSEQSVL